MGMAAILMDCDHFTNFQFSFDRRLLMNFEETWPRVSEKSSKIVDEQQMDGRLGVITIAHSEPDQVS